MPRGLGTTTTGQLHELQHLAGALGDAVTLGDVARAAVSACMRLDGVISAGLAVIEGDGRRLRLLSSAEDESAAMRWRLIDGYDDVPLTRVLREGMGVYLSTLECLAETFPDILDEQRALGTRSLAALPFLRGDERIGGLQLSYDTDHEFDSQEQVFLGAFAGQVTEAVRRGLGHQIQQTHSELLQRSLMPPFLPDIDGLALGSYYQPGGLNVDVGGDWYDVMELPNGRVVVSLGDVVGKGVPASVMMSEVRAAMRAYAMLDPTPGVVLERLDRLVTTLAIPEQMVTMLYGLIQPQRGAMRLAVAGHPAPLLVPGQGRPEVLDGEIGPALGIGAGPWPEKEVELTEGSTVLFFSDGLVESRQVDLSRGVDLLRERVADMGTRRRNPRELCARLGELVRREDADDDVTLLAAAVTTVRREHIASVDLPPDATAAGLARRFVSAKLESWGIDQEVIREAELCVSELVTNAIIHSGTRPGVTVKLDGERVFVLVSDRGNRDTVHRPDHYDPMSVSGRGLTLVDALATDWSAEHNDAGTTVWFELTLERTADRVLTDE